MSPGRSTCSPSTSPTGSRPRPRSSARSCATSTSRRPPGDAEHRVRVFGWRRSRLAGGGRRLARALRPLPVEVRPFAGRSPGRSPTVPATISPFCAATRRLPVRRCPPDPTAGRQGASAARLRRAHGADPASVPIAREGQPATGNSGSAQLRQPIRGLNCANTDNQRGQICGIPRRGHRPDGKQHSHDRPRRPGHRPGHLAAHVAALMRKPKEPRRLGVDQWTVRTRAAGVALATRAPPLGFE
jgi:hypothetical protein